VHLDLARKIPDSRDHLVEAPALFEDADGGPAPGHVHEFSVEAQAVPELRDASPDHVIGAESASDPQDVVLLQIRLVQLRQDLLDGLPADEFEFSPRRKPGLKHVPDAFFHVIDIFPAVNGKRKNGDGLPVAGEGGQNMTKIRNRPIPLNQRSFIVTTPSTGPKVRK
jgi:hypothetical protein